MKRCRESYDVPTLTPSGRPADRLAEWTAVLGAGLVVLWALLMGAGLANAQSGLPDRGSDEIARVNGVPITRQAFQRAYRQAVDQYAREGHPIDETHLAPLRRKVIQRMVEEELLVQESRRLGITISGEEVDRDMAAARARFETPAAFRQELARLHLDETEYRRQLKRQRAIDRLLSQQVDPSVSVSPEAIRRFYDANPERYQAPEKIRVRHILIRKASGDEDASGAAYRKITMIRERLVQGGDFAELATAYSQDPEHEHGGDLGFIQRSQMPPSIASAVFDLKVGQISPILTTEHGYHLFQVTERRPATVIPFAEAQSEIRQTLLQAEQKKAIRAYIEVLRKRAEIESAQ